MRVELQFRCWPVGWSAFTLFCAVYAAGFMPSWRVPQGPILNAVEGGPIIRLFWAYFVIVGLTWASAFAEPKGFVRMRRWRDTLAQYSAQRILRVTPAWAPGLLMALACGALLVLVAPFCGEPYYDAVDEMFSSAVGSAMAFCVALFLFLLRDIGIIHFLTMDGRSRRVFFTALVNFAVLYVLMPTILVALDLTKIVPVLLPSPIGHPVIVIVPVLVQVFLVAGLIAWRWARLAGAMEPA
jgi:hypothetical protein